MSYKPPVEKKQTTGGKPMKKESLEERLRKYPALRARFEAILEMVENETGECVRADEVEERLILELRQLGGETLQQWATQQEQQVTRYWDERAGVSRKEKKVSPGRPCSDESR
jgi:uncharacterized protein YPO0396